MGSITSGRRRERAAGPGHAPAQGGYTTPNLCYLNRVGNYRNLGYEPSEAPDYPHAPEDDTLVAALRARRAQKEPFYLWYHYKFVHLPYWAAEPYRRRMGIDDDAIPRRLRESVCSGFVGAAGVRTLAGRPGSGTPTLRCQRASNE